MDERVLQASIIVSLVDMFEEGFDRREDIARDDVVNLIYLSLVVSREILLVLIVTWLDFVHTHLQQVAVGSEKV